MSLSNPIFWLCFTLFFCAYHSKLCQKSNANRKSLLLGGGLLFLACNSLTSLLELTLFTVLSFGAVRVSTSARAARFRTVIIGFAVAIILAVTVFAKVRGGGGAFGISFYALFLIGYLVAAHNGPLPRQMRFGDLFTGVSFFPNVSAGPVARVGSLLEQLAKPVALDFPQAREAAFRIAAGLAKKTTGDMLSIVSDRYFEITVGSGPCLRAWLGTLALAGYYYADLSGYTDIAIGTAQLLGIRLPENFRCPYFADSVAEHWRRWHISINDWFREFVFTPLFLRPWPSPFKALIYGGQRRTGAALMVTMALIGLWHGLSWNYLLWGLYNGFFILLPLRFGRTDSPRSGWKKFAAIGLTFYIVMIGRVLTRAENLGKAKAVWYQMHNFANVEALSLYEQVIFGLVILGLLLPHIFDWIFFVKKKPQLSPGYQFALITLLLAFTFCFAMGGRPFLYENF